MCLCVNYGKLGGEIEREKGITVLGRLLSASHSIQAPMHQNVPSPAPQASPAPHILPACS